MRIEGMREFYGKLSDDISRELFVNRFLYNLTGSQEYLNGMVRQFYPVRKIQEFIDEKNANATVVVYGVGKNGMALLPLLNVRGDTYAVDSNKAGSTVGDIPIYSPNEYFGTDKGRNFIVVITPYPGFEEIEDQLLSYGVSKDNMVSFGRLWEEMIHHEYFEDFVTHDKDEVFVDAGVYDGQTTREFVRWSDGDYDHIYMFEPSGDYFDRYFGNVKEIDRCDWIKKGLWNKEETISLFQRADSDISTDENLDGITDKYVYGEGNRISIPVTSIDTELGNERVTFIKMDIEGSEIDALEGARGCIEQCHPKLAICIYHKLDDIWQLPLKILSFYDGYRFYLRHYSMDMLDTVLYAIP